MNPRTVKEVITDFMDRREGIIKALSKDVNIFYNSCDPKHSSLCLYGLPSQRWEVKPPPSPSQPPRLPPSEIPEPRLGINLVRDDMTKSEWLYMVALHSDAWLHSVASYFCSKNKFNKAERKRVFNKIFDVDSVSELLTSKTMRKRMKAEGLPHEIQVEILARLPVKDLLRYRSVCKKWLGIIDDPSFVNIHLEIYQSNIVGDRLYVFEKRPSVCQSNIRVMVRYSDTFRQATTLPNIGKYVVLGHVNGLFLISLQINSSPAILLWNPSLEKSQNISYTMVPPMNHFRYYVSGLGFDANTNDYKVVSFTYTAFNLFDHSAEDIPVVDRYRGIISKLTRVYSLRTNSWTTKNDAHPPSLWVVGPQVDFNNAIHWMGFGPNLTNNTWALNENCSHIVSFDVGNEVFNYSELPINVIESGNRNTTFVTVMDDCLAIFCGGDFLHDIWVMKEYENPNSWIKCYTFPLKYHDKGLYFKRNGEFLYAANGVGIKSYDIKRNCERDLAKTYNKKSTYVVFTYVESLVMSNLPREDDVEPKST